MSTIFNQIKYAFPTKFVEVKDYKIAYIDEGSSDLTLLFIHGLGSYLRAWERNIPELKNHFRCVAIDLPGYGKSSKIVHSGEIPFYTEFLFDFIKALNLKNVCLVGHSMGGQIAASFVLEYPGLTDKLVLVAPAGFELFTEEDIELLKRLVSPEILFKTSDKQIRLNYQWNFYKMPSEAETMIEDRILIKQDDDFYKHCIVVSNSLFGLLKKPIFNRLNQIQIPTLILYGLQDALIPNKALHSTTTKEIAKSGASQIKNNNLVLINECGHFIPFEKPDKLNSELIKFTSDSFSK